MASEVGALGEGGEQTNKWNKQINKHDRKASVEERWDETPIQNTERTL